jgi:lactoylglutathione lyase
VSILDADDGQLEVHRGHMKSSLEKAYGYKGDTMNLPVRELASALPFYETVLGFQLLSRSETPFKSAVLGRDQVQIRLAENGGDPAQDGCAFHVTDVESLLAEFKANGLEKEISRFDVEQHGNAAWKVFYVVAPDGLCYWFGERQGDRAETGSRPGTV